MLVPGRTMTSSRSPTDRVVLSFQTCTPARRQCNARHAGITPSIPIKATHQHICILPARIRNRIPRPHLLSILVVLAHDLALHYLAFARDRLVAERDVHAVAAAPAVAEAHGRGGLGDVAVVAEPDDGASRLRPAAATTATFTTVI
jgi:hypothetical protein